jgi:hypothetical protein
LEILKIKGAGSDETAWPVKRTEKEKKNHNRQVKEEEKKK